MSDHPDIRKLIGHLATLADATGNYMLAKTIRADFYGASSCVIPSAPSGAASSTAAPTSTPSPSSPVVGGKVGASGADGSANQTPFIVEGHPDISAKYRVKRLGYDAPYTEWGTYDQADRDRTMLTLGWNAAKADALPASDDDTPDEDRCGHCGRRCPNSMCERCKMDLDRQECDK